MENVCNKNLGQVPVWQGTQALTLPEQGELNGLALCLAEFGAAMLGKADKYREISIKVSSS